MSIHDLLYKIKGRREVINTTFTYILLMILVAFGSFFLGQLSVSSLEVKSDIEIVNRESVVENDSNVYQDKLQSTTLSVVKGKYVASKNGKLYYTVTCKASNRIKEENKVYFDTTADAEKSGYSWATSCK